MVNLGKQINVSLRIVVPDYTTVNQDFEPHIKGDNLMTTPAVMALCITAPRMTHEIINHLGLPVIAHPM